MTTDGVVHLLDANVLIALVAADHVHHQAVGQWWTGERRAFATCPITQGALIRFLVREGWSGAEAAQVWDGIRTAEGHSFWSADLGFDQVNMRSILGHRQVTDAYLAALAGHHQGRLATLDRGLAALHGDVADLVPTG